MAIAFVVATASYLVATASCQVAGTSLQIATAATSEATTSTVVVPKHPAFGPSSSIVEQLVAVSQ